MTGVLATEEETLPFSSMKLEEGERLVSGMVALRDDMGTLSSWELLLARAAWTAAAIAPRVRGEEVGEQGREGGKESERVGVS